MCMTFGCNPQIIIVLFKQFERRHFLARHLPKHKRCDQKHWECEKHAVMLGCYVKHFSERRM